jgi:phage terminase small subunit
MSRKSGAALSVVPLRSPRLRPPADLAPAQRAIWLQTVNSVAADHFRPLDVALLRTFCEVTALLRRAEGKLRLGVVAGDQTNPWLRIFEANCRLQVTLGRALRITTHSRTDKTVAARTARQGPPQDSAQPWNWEPPEGDGPAEAVAPAGPPD